MTTHDLPDGSPPGRTDNGLRAATYVPLTDVAPDVGQHLLTTLGRARIAAYLGPAAADTQQRLFVATDERGDARTIVAAAVKALGEPAPQLPQPVTDPLAGKDTDAIFNELVADWHVDTHNAVRQAERDLTNDDAEWRTKLSRPPAEEPVWLDDDHYIPPPPPPLPRLAAPTILAMAVLALSILVLGLGGQFGLASTLTLFLGIGGLLLGGLILMGRLRAGRGEDDDDGVAI